MNDGPTKSLLNLMQPQPNTNRPTQLQPNPQPDLNLDLECNLNTCILVVEILSQFARYEPYGHIGITF
jgi:hypothetical protein